MFLKRPSETESSRAADPSSTSEGDRGEGQFARDNETYDENEEDLLEVHETENKTNTDNSTWKLESNKILTKKETRKWSKVKP